MATIVATFGTGLAGITPAGSGTPTLATILRDIADDITALRAAHVGVVAKLDADAGVTDTNYTSLWTPATQKTIKG